MGDTVKKATVLVTGGAGYIGSHTVVELLDQGYDVIIVDNFSNSKPEVLRRIREITGKDFLFYKKDLLDKDGLEEVFEKHRIDAVIHFAGLKAVGESVAKPMEYYHNNLTGTLNLCSLMQKHNIKRMVFSSSATVYGVNNKAPFTEDMPLSAINPYGWTKFMIEQILRDIYVADNSWSTILLRYFNPIGAHESGRIGEDPNGIPNNLMPYITQVAVGKLEYLKVFGDDYDTHDGTGVRDYIHVVDLAKGHISALEKVLTSAGIDAVNLGTGEGYSVLDVVKSFENANGIKIPYKVTGRRPGDIDICFADTSKALRVLDWKAEKTLEDMCRDSWNWQKNNPDGYGE
ncbi:MAG TPA: UDP-glucose 4-epimerase GalE [Thermoclostridium sp.]|nr:UDP-glucose 4-epimerase GalE [Thermoclostridium sp.]